MEVDTEEDLATDAEEQSKKGKIQASQQEGESSGARKRPSYKGPEEQIAGCRKINKKHMSMYQRGKLRLRANLGETSLGSGTAPKVQKSKTRGGEARHEEKVQATRTEDQEAKTADIPDSHEQTKEQRTKQPRKEKAPTLRKKWRKYRKECSPIQKVGKKRKKSKIQKIKRNHRRKGQKKLADRVEPNWEQQEQEEDKKGTQETTRDKVERKEEDENKGKKNEKASSEDGTHPSGKTLEGNREEQSEKKMVFAQKSIRDYLQPGTRGLASPTVEAPADLGQPGSSATKEQLTKPRDQNMGEQKSEEEAESRKTL